MPFRDFWFCNVVTNVHSHKSGVYFTFDPRALKPKKKKKNIEDLRLKMTKNSLRGPALPLSPQPFRHSLSPLSHCLSKSLSLSLSFSLSLSLSLFLSLVLILWNLLPLSPSPQTTVPIKLSCLSRSTALKTKSRMLSMLYIWGEETFWKETFDEISMRTHTRPEVVLINIFFLPERNFLWQQLRQEGGGTKISDASQKLFEKFLDDKQSMGVDICQAAEEIGQVFKMVQSRVLYDKMQQLVKVRLANCNRCLSAHTAFPPQKCDGHRSLLQLLESLSLHSSPMRCL